MPVSRALAAVLAGFAPAPRGSHLALLRPPRQRPAEPAPPSAVRYDYVEFTVVNNAAAVNVKGDVPGTDRVGILPTMCPADPVLPS